MTEILAAKVVAGEMKLNEAHRDEGLCAAARDRHVDEHRQPLASSYGSSWELFGELLGS